MTITKKSSTVREIEKIRKKSMTFSDLLKSARNTDEITQAELARRCKTSKAKICDYEKGRRRPTLEIAAKLAKALGHSQALFVSMIVEEQLKEAKLKLKIKIEAAQFSG